MNKLRSLIELNMFGVCSWIGERFDISTATIRKYFIYISFLAVGSPVVIYFILAFWMNIKQYISYGKRNPLKY